MDFSIFYASGEVLSDGGNPYQALIPAQHLALTLLPANLNPPFVLWLMKPLSSLNYYYAIAVWSAFSITLGMLGANIAFKLAFSEVFLRRNRFYLNLIYLSFFATLMDTALAQLGAVLLFLVMMGYDLYLKNKDYSAGVLWAAAISIKFFPALLIIYALVQKRYKVAVTMVAVFLWMILIPLFVYGANIYIDYFSLMSHVTWYGKSWNASILGMIARLGLEENNRGLLYGIIFCLGFMLYVLKIKKIEMSNVMHQSFCWTIITMLFLSPLGWLYYFTLLTFPLTFLYIQLIHDKKYTMTTMVAWILSLFLINVPINNTPLTAMTSWMEKVSIYSFNFYGLLLLAYLLIKMPAKPLYRAL